MDYPDIEVRGGRIRDCVNVVFRCFTVEEIKALLRKLGWIRTFARHDAHLQGREPVLELQYAIIPEAVRYHIRYIRIIMKLLETCISTDSSRIWRRWISTSRTTKRV
jgi:hypothetical protein